MMQQHQYEEICQQVALLAVENGRNPAELTVIAVSKGRSLEQLSEVYRSGCRDFGENRVQEALSKMDLPANWHFIGALQRKKVPKVIGKFSLVHSVDTPELAEKIATCSEEKNEITSILLQANTSGEPEKQGLTAEEWCQAFPKLLELPGIAIKGMMTMAPLTDDEHVVRSCFSGLRYLRDDLQEIAGKRADLHHLSMGMTHDYPIAVQEGATLLRVGTAIFGHIYPS